MKIKVMIADDHQLFIDGVKSILANESDISIIAEVSNGLALIKELEKGTNPDIIITDIRMPVMDGMSATKVLTKDFPGIPVLALTMYDQDADIYEMMEAGAKGYVTKDANKEELIAAIHALTKGENYFSKNLPENFKNFNESKPENEKQELTRREIEILALVAKGRTTIEMAKELKLSKFTIDTHRKNIHKKLGIKTNAGLVKFALKNLNLNI